MAELQKDQICRTQREAAAYIGRSARCIRRWREQGMLIVIIDGKQCYLKEQLNFFKNAEGKIPTEAKTKGQTADARYKHAKADLMEIELEEKQGEIRKQAEEITIPKILAIKRGLLSLERRITAGLPKEWQRPVRKIVKQEVRYLINSLANQ